LELRHKRNITAATILSAMEKDGTRSTERIVARLRDYQLRDHGIVSLLNVPIMINGAIWGVLEIDSERSHAFDE
jgi:putative methionine-R-sulfoxide reductase with GAF domain